MRYYNYTVGLCSCAEGDFLTFSQIAAIPAFH